MGSIVFNSTTIPDYNAGVSVNGTEILEVYFNGTKQWSRHPYPVGTDVFTFQYCPGSTLLNFVTNYYNNYPLVFASQPFISSGNGSGYPDSIMSVTLKAGFNVINVNNGERGNFPVGATTPGFTMGVYNTFTSFSGNVASFAGNGCTSFTVRYVGN